jgi:hypothetical protein
MLGIDIVNYKFLYLLFGLVMVPVTHTSHTISAKTDVPAAFKRAFANFLPEFAPARLAVA